MAKEEHIDRTYRHSVRATEIHTRRDRHMHKYRETVR